MGPVFNFFQAGVFTQLNMEVMPGKISDSSTNHIIIEKFIFINFKWFMRFEDILKRIRK